MDILCSIIRTTEINMFFETSVALDSGFKNIQCEEGEAYRTQEKIIDTMPLYALLLDYGRIRESSAMYCIYMISISRMRRLEEQVRMVTGQMQIRLFS